MRGRQGLGRESEAHPAFENGANLKLGLNPLAFLFQAAGSFSQMLPERRRKLLTKYGKRAFIILNAGQMITC